MFAQIPSDKVPFNEAPDMKAFEITQAGKEALLSGKYHMVRLNYANPDMVRASSFFARSWAVQRAVQPLLHCGLHALHSC